jgi:glycosyltransferase involved in cell wall biosynthesis
MPTTIARRWCIPLAIECFARQTHPDRELLVVFDGPGSIKDLIRDAGGAGAGIRLVELPGKRSLGNKFNACVELAEHDLVALWADDDWHAPTRLEKTVALFDDAPIVGTRKMLFHDLVKRETWLYDWRSPQHFLLGGTLAFRRSVWERSPFPDVESAVDNGFVYEAITTGAHTYAVIPGSSLYVAMVHGNNTRAEFTPNWPYRAWPGDLHEIMGDDYDDYARAFTGPTSRG